MIAPLVPVLWILLLSGPPSAESAPPTSQPGAIGTPAARPGTSAAPTKPAAAKPADSGKTPARDAKEPPTRNAADARPQHAANTEPPPPASQPASQPTEPPSTGRLPKQAEIFRALIERGDQARPIEPVRPERGAQSSQPADQKSVLLEGEQIVNREARFVRGGPRPELVIQPKDGGSPQSFPVLESQLLEVVEREAETGVEEFLITAEAKLYRGRNYLLLLKVMRRVPNGNIAP